MDSQNSANTTRHLLRGRYYELAQTVNVIPKGVYKLERVDKLGALFSVGRRKKIQFFVSSEAAEHIKPIAQTTGQLKRTKQETFLDTYYKLLEMERGEQREFNSFAPVTMCFLDPSVAR